MRRWFRRLLDKALPPTPPSLPISEKDWPGLMAELAEGYDKHKAVFQAVQIMLKKAEREAFRAPSFKSPADIVVWMVEQYGMVREVQALRGLLRLPIEAQRLAQRKDAEDNVAKAQSEDDAALD